MDAKVEPFCIRAAEPYITRVHRAARSCKQHDQINSTVIIISTHIVHIYNTDPQRQRQRLHLTKQQRERRQQRPPQLGHRGLDDFTARRGDWRTGEEFFMGQPGGHHCPRTTGISQRAGRTRRPGAAGRCRQDHCFESFTRTLHRFCSSIPITPSTTFGWHACRQSFACSYTENSRSDTSVTTLTSFRGVHQVQDVGGFCGNGWLQKVFG